MAGIGEGHGGWKSARLVWSAGLAALASGDLDDDVDFGVYLSVRFDLGGFVTVRYELIVPETDAAIGGRELELIQGFSLGLSVLF